jgi:hypothetical protein
MMQSGRASLLSILAILAILMVVGLLAFTKESPNSVAGRFMAALQKGDVNTLTDMSYLGSDSKEDMRKQWDFAVNKAGRYYMMMFRVVGHNQPSPNTANVRMMVVRNADKPGAYEEAFALPLIKVGDDWKVDVKAISREMYPALPR